MHSLKQSLQKTFSLRSGPIILFAIVIMVLTCFLSVTPVLAQSSTDPPSDVNIPDIEPEAGEIYLAVWIIDIYAFDFKTGSYTFDMILSFFWSDPTISSINWHIMNGAPNYSGAFYFLANGSETDGIKWEFYRATADLGTPLDAADYPFDVIELPIAIEILGQGVGEISLSWIESEVGIGSGYDNQGWEDPTFELRILDQNYPYNIIVERAEMVVVQMRQRQSSRATVIPPLIFCVVSAFAFLLRLDSSGVGMRFGLNTSMLITTVLFNISEESNLPPSSSITLWEVFIVSVLVFISLNTLTTVVGYLEFSHGNSQERLRKINRWGFLVSLIVPIVLFILLYYLF